MAKVATILIALGTILNDVLLVRGGDINTFSVTARSIPQQNGGCIYSVTVDGKGIWDNFDLPCSAEEGALAVGNSKYALFYSPSHSLSFYTDEANNLVVIEKGKCTKKYYKLTQVKKEIKTSTMKSRKCNKVKSDFDQAKAENKKARLPHNKDYWATLADKAFATPLPTLVY